MIKEIYEKIEHEYDDLVEELKEKKEVKNLHEVDRLNYVIGYFIIESTQLKFKNYLLQKKIDEYGNNITIDIKS